MKHERSPRHGEQACGCEQGVGRSGKDWEFGVSRCTLLYIEWLNNKVLLYSTGNYIQNLAIKHNGKDMKKNTCVCVYVDICVNISTYICVCIHM